jgi:hypothetical protein
MIDLVVMPSRLWNMKHLILVREELLNFVEGRALKTKSTEGICRFILKDIFSKSGTVEARSFFERHGVKLRLAIAYNLETNGKNERGHPPIINALVKSYKRKPKQWPRLLPFAL